MKYIKYIVLTLLLIIPLKINALSISFSCPTTVKSGENYTCTVYGPQYCVEAIFNLELPQGFIYKSNKPGENYTLESTAPNFVFKGTGLHTRILTTIEITVPEVGVDTKYSINLKDIKYKITSEDENYYQEENITKNINVKTKITTKSTTNTTTTSKKPQQTKNFVLTLDSNGGKEKNQTLSCTPENNKCEVNLLNVQTPTKDGYVFKGWGKSKECTDGTNNEYNVTKNETLYACWQKSTNQDPVYLKSLEITGYELEFSKFKFTYELNVPLSVTKLEIKAEAVNEKAQITYENPEELKEGLNTIKIIVKEDEKESTYTINVNRSDVTTEQLDNTELSGILIAGYDFEIKKGVYNYNLKINKEDKTLSIVAIPSYPKATYEVYGNEDLKDKSVIIITVTSVSGKTQNYEITIEVDTFFEENKKYFIAAGIIIFMLTVYFIIKHQKNEEKKLKENNGISPKIKKEKKEKLPKEKKSKKNKKVKNNDNEVIETLV